MGNAPFFFPFCLISPFLLLLSLFSNIPQIFTGLGRGGDGGFLSKQEDESPFTSGREPQLWMGGSQGKTHESCKIEGLGTVGF